MVYRLNKAAFDYVIGEIHAKFMSSKVSIDRPITTVRVPSPPFVELAYPPTSAKKETILPQSSKCIFPTPPFSAPALLPLGEQSSFETRPSIGV